MFDIIYETFMDVIIHDDIGFFVVKPKKII